MLRDESGSKMVVTGMNGIGAMLTALSNTPLHTFDASTPIAKALQLYEECLNETFGDIRRNASTMMQRIPECIERELRGMPRLQKRDKGVHMHAWMHKLPDAVKQWCCEQREKPFVYFYVEQRMGRPSMMHVSIVPLVSRRKNVRKGQYKRDASSGVHRLDTLIDEADWIEFDDDFWSDDNADAALIEFGEWMDDQQQEREQRVAMLRGNGTTARRSASESRPVHTLHPRKKARV